MNRKKPSKRNWATIVGSGLAHVQNTVDEVADWGFKKMNELGAKPVKSKKSEKKVVTNARRAGHFALKFLGSTGEAYFEKYGELKRKK